MCIVIYKIEFALSFSFSLFFLLLRWSEIYVMELVTFDVCFRIRYLNYIYIGVWFFCRFSCFLHRVVLFSFCDCDFDLRDMHLEFKVAKSLDVIWDGIITSGEEWTSLYIFEHKIVIFIRVNDFLVNCKKRIWNITFKCPWQHTIYMAFFKNSNWQLIIKLQFTVYC